MNPIFLLPLGGASRALVSALCAPLEEVFGTAVAVRETGIRLDRFLDPGRLQYNSTAIIGHLWERYRDLTGVAPDDGDACPRLLAVVEEDLFIPILTYVFGEAQLNGRVAVVSSHRLQSERYGLPPDPALLLERLQKEAVHELGHLFGLLHCPAQGCAMHISTYVEDIDLKPAGFCSSCRTRVAVRDRD